MSEKQRHRPKTKRDGEKRSEEKHIEEKRNGEKRSEEKRERKSRSERTEEERDPIERLERARARNVVHRVIPVKRGTLRTNATRLLKTLGSDERRKRGVTAEANEMLRGLISGELRLLARTVLHMMRARRRGMRMNEELLTIAIAIHGGDMRYTLPYTPTE